MTLETFLRQHLRVTAQEGDELRAFCPFHTDEKPSFSANLITGAWRCFSQCGGGRGPKSLCKKLKIEYPKDITAALTEPAFVEPKYVPESEITEACARLAAAGGPRKYLQSRGISDEVSRKTDLGLGLDSDPRIWIPVRDAEGRCVQVKLYDWTKLQPAKFICYGSTKDGYGGNRIWPAGVVENHKEVYLFAGEPDCLLAHSLGIENAITTTGGEGSWDDSFTRMLAGKKVNIIYDIDAAGVAGANKLVRALGAAATVRVLQLPISEPKNGDFTDWVRQQSVDFRKFSEWAGLASVPSLLHTGLISTARSENFQKDLKLRSTVSGKDLAPYMVPKQVLIGCDYSAQNKACIVCPLRAFQGHATIDLEDGSAPLIASVASGQLQVDAELRSHIGIPQRCPGHKLLIAKRVPVWDVRLTNDLDSEEGQEDGEFIARRAFTQVEMQANAPYDLTAIATADPKTQKSLLYVKEATSSQTGLDTFTIEGKEHLLKLFEVTNEDGVADTATH